MSTGKTPAFYALGASGAWKDYVNLLHIPYTLWHLSYVVLGAALASTVHVDRLIGTVVAFFLAMGIGAHALDELNGRPLGTRIPRAVLIAMAVVSLTGALVMGTVAGLIATLWLFPFMAFGAFIAVAYNLGLWHDRFHSDYWFAFAWGAFPALTSYWIQSVNLTATVILLALACFTLSLAQRALSTQVRTIRRRTLNVAGTMEMTDGSIVTLDSSSMILAAERALVLLSVTVVVLAASLLAYRLIDT
ncbi:MAG: hypothetical protein IIB30_04275 [Chloroflexi bacterium]|nr:hypothetical protein [Chloroflexota bacterium]MCH8225373.1 hypothetical protein [Chloroflexota bacterium]